MRATTIAAAALAAVALTGCVVRAGYHDGYGSTSASVEVEHSYTYFPSEHAYYCDSCNEWWVIGTGGWIRSRERPRTVVITQATPWVVVNVRGPQPQVRYEEHSREYPANWKPHEPKGPPPGRGWRK